MDSQPYKMLVLEDTRASHIVVIVAVHLQVPEQVISQRIREISSIELQTKELYGP